MREPPGPVWGRAASCCLLPRQISGVACCPTGVPGAAWCAVGPGCWLCPWAAARPRAVRAASFARRVASKPGQAPPPPTGTAARPSGPSGALHTSGAWSLMLLGALSRSPAGPRRRPPAPRQIPPAPFTQVGPGVLTCACMSARSPARPRRRPRVPQPGPVGQGVRLSETGIAFAGAGRAPIETAIAFAGEKKLFFVHFSVAVVLPVSMVAVWGRAVVPAVSYWPASVAAEVLLVSKLARGCVLCAKKFALRTKYGPN